MNNLSAALKANTFMNSKKAAVIQNLFWTQSRSFDKKCNSSIFDANAVLFIQCKFHCVFLSI